jgi:anti-sigma regulatory factor (Ser/Thr protein kinase)
VKGLEGRIPFSFVDRVELLLSELITNSVKHARVQPGAKIGIVIEVKPDLLRIEVADRGEGFRSIPHPRPGDVKGWGLYLVNEMADRWGFRSNDETTVWFELDLPASLSDQETS